MKTRIISKSVIIFLTFIFLTHLVSCSSHSNKSGSSLRESNITSSESNFTEFIPTELFAKTTTIVAELEVLCNDNGIPLKLNHKEDRKNELEGWVSDYTVADRENQFFYVIYDKESYISTVTITFTDSGNDADFYKFQKMMYYTLQIQELHIPIDEANQVIQKFNSESASKFWQLDTNNRSYTYMLDTDTGFETFSIRYNY